MKKDRLRIDKVKASRDGHEFHEAWAARKSLQLVMPTDELVGIAVEGLAPADQTHSSAETVEIADLVLYYGNGPSFRHAKSVVIVQAKYSISSSSVPFRASDAKKTITKFAVAFKDYKKRYATKDVDKKLTFELVTNRPIAPEFSKAIDGLAAGSPLGGNAKKQASQFSSACGFTVTLDEWNAGKFYVTDDYFIGSSPLSGGSLEDKTPHKFQTLNIRLPISRRWTGPFVTIILPLFMIGFAAVALLYLKDDSFANEGQICVGIFLSIVTYSIAFAQITPRANVLTIADMLFYITFLAVLLVFLKVILLSSSMVTRRSKNWMKKRSTLIGHIGLASYCSVTIAILLTGLI